MGNGPEVTRNPPQPPGRICATSSDTTAATTITALFGIKSESSGQTQGKVSELAIDPYVKTTTEAMARKPDIYGFFNINLLSWFKVFHAV